MGDRLGVAAGPHLLTYENRRDVIGLAAVVLVPGEDQQAVVPHRPVRVRADVGPQPGIPGPDAAVVHVVAQVRNHEGHRGKPREGSGGEAGKRKADRAGHVAEIRPRHVLAHVVAGRAHRRPGPG